MTSITDQLHQLATVLAVELGDVVLGATLVALVIAVGLVELEAAAEDRRRAASAARRRAAETWEDVRPVTRPVRELPRPLPRIARIPATPRPGSVPPVPPTAEVRA